MEDAELKSVVIDEFANLQRIKAVEDRAAEIKFQERILKAKMRVLGIPTDNLELKA